MSRWPGEGRTSARMLALARELLEQLDAAKAGPWEPATPQAQRIVTRWCWQACAHDGTHRRAAASTAAYRQRIARAVFEEAARLGASADPDAVVGEPIAPPRKPVRGLTGDENRRVRKWADEAPQGSRQPVAAALSYAGATPTQIAQVRVGDIDLDNATVTFGGAAARVATLDDWGMRAVRRYLHDNGPVAAGDLVCVSVRTTPEREVESVAGLLRRLLRTAGLYGLEGVAVDSIRLAAARQVLLSDGIAAAARFLGWTSLDRTAAVLGHNWRHPDD